MILPSGWPVPTFTGLLILAWLVLLAAWAIGLYLSASRDRRRRR